MEPDKDSDLYQIKGVGLIDFKARRVYFLMTARMRRISVPVVLAGAKPKNKKGVTITRNAFLLTAKFVVGRAGFEPATNGLKVRCSTS
jgi:hypothetical protein